MSSTAPVTQIIEDAFGRVAEELVYLAPRIFVASLVLALIIVVGIVLNRLVNKFLDIARVDDLVKPYIKKYGVPFTPRSIVNASIVIGLATLSIYSTVAIAAPQYIEPVTGLLEYIGRIVSVAIMLLIIVTSIAAVFDRVRVERGIKGFAFLITVLLSIALLIDITSLSPEVKNSIVWGLSLGIGLSIGIFTAWYFFEDIVREKARKKS